MRYKVVCIRDRAIDAYGVPVFVASIGSAIRSFTDEINRAAEDNQMYKHPEDFDLYSLGEFDGDSGTFECERPRQIAVGKDVKVS